jgi:hypothetical protein
MLVTTHIYAVISADEFGTEADRMMTPELKTTIRNIYMENCADSAPVTALAGDAFVTAISVF